MNLNLSIATIENGNKVSPIFEHTFTPLKEFPEVKITCEYFKTGEKSKYLTFGPDGAIIDFRKLFADKVKAIEGIKITYNDSKEPVEIKTARELLNLPDVDSLSEIIQSTGTHIFMADGLTGDEVKNLD